MPKNPERPCLIKRLYKQLDPYIQITGWLVIAIPVIGSCITYLTRQESFAKDIEALNRFKDATQLVLPALVQEVHDIHEIVVPPNYRPRTPPPLLGPASKGGDGT